MKLKYILLIILVIVLATAGFFSFVTYKTGNILMISNFEECASAGYPIMESYPEQCKTPDGRNFIRTINSEDVNLGAPIVLSETKYVKFNDGLQVTLIEINDSRCKEGMVCVWAGELSPKFNVVGGNTGKSAQELIMGTSTKDTVVLNGYIFTLNKATETTATIMVVKKSETAAPCHIGGCNMEICFDNEDIISSCIYEEEYACYKTATCERQANNQCGWTQTSELKACLNSK